MQIQQHPFCECASNGEDATEDKFQIPPIY